MRNTGSRKLELNKTKFLNYNPKLLQICKNGSEVITLKYIPVLGKFYSNWKFLVINYENNNNKFMIKKGLQK